MSKKEKVDIIRPNDFESIDEELAAAMSGLDEVNSRVLDLLYAESGTEVAEETGEDSSDAVSGEKQEHSTAKEDDSPQSEPEEAKEDE